MSKDNKAVVLYRLQSVARLSRTVLATRLLEQGLYAGQDAVMLQLAAEDGLTPGVLAQRLGVRPPTITKTIARLQSQGFVAKRASETDQRQSHVYLTQTGLETIKAIEKSIRKTEAGWRAILRFAVSRAFPTSLKRKCLKRTTWNKPAVYQALTICFDAHLGGKA